MKRIIKVNDEVEILHMHRNFQSETEFIAWNKKTDNAVNGILTQTIRKPNCIIDWDEPLTQEEINWLVAIR